MPSGLKLPCPPKVGGYAFWPIWWTPTALSGFSCTGYPSSIHPRTLQDTHTPLQTSSKSTWGNVRSRGWLHTKAAETSVTTCNKEYKLYKQFGKITRQLQSLTRNKRNPLEEEESHFKRKVTTLEYSKCSNFQSTSTQRKRKMWHISRKRRIRQTLSGESQTLGWLVKDANSTSCMCSNCSRKLWTKN